MRGHRQRRWPRIKPALVQRLLFTVILTVKALVEVTQCELSHVHTRHGTPEGFTVNIGLRQTTPYPC